MPLDTMKTLLILPPHPAGAVAFSPSHSAAHRISFTLILSILSDYPLFKNIDHSLLHRSQQQQVIRQTLSTNTCLAGAGVGGEGQKVEQIYKRKVLRRMNPMKENLWASLNHSIQVAA